MDIIEFYFLNKILQTYLRPNEKYIFINKKVVVEINEKKREKKKYGK